MKTNTEVSRSDPAAIGHRDRSTVWTAMTVPIAVATLQYSQGFCCRELRKGRQTKKDDVQRLKRAQGGWKGLLRIGLAGRCSPLRPVERHAGRPRCAGRHRDEVRAERRDCARQPLVVPAEVIGDERLTDLIGAPEWRPGIVTTAGARRGAARRRLSYRVAICEREGDGSRHRVRRDEAPFRKDVRRTAPVSFPACESGAGRPLRPRLFCRLNLMSRSFS